jgi:DNA-binding NarL/FixJ family response regulator
VSARLLLAEGDRPTRAGLSVALRSEGFQVVADAEDHAGALDAAETHRPDIALIATDLPDGGIRTVHELIDLYPRLKVIVLSSTPGGEELLAAVLAGASGYLSKEMSLERLPHAVRGVLAGEVALPRRHADHLLAELRRRDVRRQRVAAHADANLTDREWEILQMLAEGAATAEIARRLRIAQVTVRRHISTLVAKLGVKDRASAAALMQRSAD